MRKILVVRNDKPGDFTLALPAFDLLEQNLPEARTVALVPDYTEPVANLSEAIDHEIIDPGKGKPGAARSTNHVTDCRDSSWFSQRPTFSLAARPGRCTLRTRWIVRLRASIRGGRPVRHCVGRRSNIQTSAWPSCRRRLPASAMLAASIWRAVAAAISARFIG